MAAGSKKWLIYIGILFLGATAWFLLSGGDTVLLDFGDADVTVNGPEQYAFTIEYAEIRQLSLVQDPDYGTAVNGKRKGNFVWGAWQNDIWGDYSLCATQKAKSCIVLTANDGVYVFNYQNDDSTEQVYLAFLKLLEDRKTRYSAYGNGSHS